MAICRAVFLLAESQYWPAYNLLIAVEAITMDVYAHVTSGMQADAALLELPPYDFASLSFRPRSSTVRQV